MKYMWQEEEIEENRRQKFERNKLRVSVVEK